MPALSQRDRLTTLLVALAGATGVLVVVHPPAAVALVVSCLAFALAFAAPMATLTTILFLTLIVPKVTQNSLSIGGGFNHPGFFVADLLLIAGLARAAPGLLRQPPTSRMRLATIAVASLLAIVLLQMLHGLLTGADSSDAGAETRALLYLGTFLLAVPILAEPRARNRLLKCLVGLGIALGLWGVAQWVLGIDYNGDYGLRPGVRGTTSGRGQIQGGLYIFSVALTLASAVLASGQVRSARGRAALVAVVALNGISLLLTFERAFWAAAAVGVAFVVLNLEAPRRARFLRAWASTLALAALSLWVLAPSVFTTARERLVASGTYTGDSSFHYRAVESRQVLRKIRHHPIIGSGLGATIFWGQPWANKPPRHYAYSHVGYLTAAWKLGIPAAALFVALILWAVATRDPPGLPSPLSSLRTGCRAGLLGLLVAAVAFPCFTTFSVPSAIGLMLAVCAMPGPRRSGQTLEP